MSARAVLVLVGVLAACSPVAAPPAAKTEPPKKPALNPEVADAGAPPPALVTFAGGRLRGFLHRPAGSGPFPAVVFNHGSEPLPGNKLGQAQFFVPHGYVLFVPHRRGHGQSRAAGEYIGDVANDETKFVAALEAQAEDVSAAVAFLAEQPFVDARRIAVSGCSLGGIESLLAAERETKIRAAVDFAGGAITWAKMPALQQRMKTAARGAKVPVFFVQAENDFDTTPSKVLDEEMRAAHKPSRLHVFGPNGTSHEDGHAFCSGGAAPPWGPEVLEFLEASFKR